MITAENKRLIERVVNIFETGTLEGRYDKITIYPDGKDKSLQITYGRSQTTEQGNLSKLLKMYVDNEGVFAEAFAPYLARIGEKPLVKDEKFKALLRRAAREDQIMQTTQDTFFDLLYYRPAYQFFDTNAFTLPLSLLVIYDSYIHSGKIPDFLRKRFGELPPAKGGDEKKWVTSYVDIRHQWLKYHSDPLLQKTVYRTQCFKDQIAAGNWEFAKMPIVANGVSVNIS
jgi:chitosanase